MRKLLSLFAIGLLLPVAAAFAAPLKSDNPPVGITMGRSTVTPPKHRPGPPWRVHQLTEAEKKAAIQQAINAKKQRANKAKTGGEPSPTQSAAPATPKTVSAAPAQ